MENLELTATDRWSGLGVWRARVFCAFGCSPHVPGTPAPRVCQAPHDIRLYNSVWHDTAITFKEVLQEFEDWIGNHNLWSREQGGSLNSAAFVTCGNWDLKTKVPEQCRVSKIKLPTYFMEWINLKDIYLNFYNRRATGMMTMMRELQMPVVGSHHLGIDDSKNITRVVQRMLADGAVMQITAKREAASGDVKFLFKNRIR